MNKEVRHHIEFQSTDNRFGEVRKTPDYEDFLNRYEDKSEAPSLEQWQGEMANLYSTAGGGPGRMRIWLVTREELDLSDAN
jgi:hypothetical protein